MLLKTADKVFSPLAFQILILVATAFMLVPFIHYVYGGYVKYILLFGIIVCIYQLIRENLQNSFKDKASIAMLCFAFFYFVTIILNRHTMLLENLKQLVYMIVFFLLLFVPKSDKFETIWVTSFVVMIVTLFLSANSLVTFVFNINEWYVLDASYFIGSFWGLRFWGFYNPNTCGTIAVISIIASLYLVLDKKTKSKGAFITLALLTIANIILQYVVLLLSESRGTYYSFLVTIIVLTFVGIIKNCKPERISAVLRALIAIFASVLILLVLLKSSIWFQQNKDVFCVVSNEDSVDISKDTNYENYLEDILKKISSDTSALAGTFMTNTMSLKESIINAVGRNDNTYTSGRYEIWKAAITVIKEKPVFGWTREGSIEPLNVAYEKVNNSSTTAISGGGIHNIYLTIMCSSGLVGLICFLVAVTIVAVRFFALLLIKERINTGVLFSFAVVLFFLISELVESRILYTVSFYNVVFWLYLGYLNYYCLKGKTKGAEKT